MQVEYKQQGKAGNGGTDEYLRGVFEEADQKLFFGSVIGVLAVGSLLLLSSLEISAVEYSRLLIVLLISFSIMAITEVSVFMNQLKPIRTAMKEQQPTLAMLEEVYLYTHRMPRNAVQRILGPHLLGLSLPAALMTFWMIQTGLINLPYFYLLLAMVGATLVACMHALIEFFLTCSAIIPLIKEFRNRALDMYNVDFSLEGHVFVAIRPKFLISCMLIGTFPLFLLSWQHISAWTASTAVRLPDCRAIGLGQGWC